MLNRHTKLYWLLQRLFFPAMVVGLPVFAHYLIAAGLHISIATYVAVVTAWVIFFSFERLMPYRREWNENDGAILTDALNMGISYGILPKLITPALIAALAGATAWLAENFGGRLWPSDWPLWVQVVLLLLAGDAGRYWGHRLAHEVSWLWRFHAVHHSASRLWFFNASRQHPVDKTVFTISELLVPTLMGVSGEVIVLYFAVTVVCGYSQHCNIHLKLGPLYWFFNVVELHRWHHSIDEKESNANYGNNLIVYDRLFGTYFHPERQGKPEAEVGDIGVLNRDYPQTYWAQILAPFRKGKLDKYQAATAANASKDDEQALHKW